MAVPGFAGVGKSYMTRSAKALLEQHGFTVTARAPYGSQKKALESEGIEARTLQSFLKAKNKKLDSNSVVFIDEAGVIPARQMLDTDLALEGSIAFKGGRTGGDWQDRGIACARDPCAGGQRSERAVRSYRQGLCGFDARAARANARHHGHESESQALNDGIQRALGLKGNGREYTLLDRLDTTQAEIGLLCGEQYTVLGTGPGNRVTVKGPGGAVFTFSPAQTTQLSVYNPERIEVWGVPSAGKTLNLQKAIQMYRRGGDDARCLRRLQALR